MAKHNTGIEWTHLPGFKGETWNPIVGCSVVSPGCTNCYAMSMASRLQKMGVQQYQGLTVPSKAGPVWNGRLNLAPESVLTKPLRWSKPRAVFVNSMGDLFHEDASAAWIEKVFAIMAMCPQHIFMVLTKRSGRMRNLLRSYQGRDWVFEHGKGFDRQTTVAKDVPWPLPNVWLGVSVEDQDRASQRIPDLLHTPAAKRFLSCEPLLGPVDLRTIDINGDGETDALYSERWGSQIESWRGTDPDWKESFEDWFGRHPDELNPDAAMYRPIDWVIAGGESGSKARPMHPDWVRSLRDQCAETEVPFFFKQWGEWLPISQMASELEAKLYPTPPKTDPLRSMQSKYDHRVLDTKGVVRDVGDGLAFTGPSPMSVFKVGKRNSGHLFGGVKHHCWPEVAS